VAGVALGAIDGLFVRQGGTDGTGLALVAPCSVWRRGSFAWQAWHFGVALGDIDAAFLWQALAQSRTTISHTFLSHTALLGTSLPRTTLSSTPL